MPLDNQGLVQKTTLKNVLDALKDVINYNMNCVKVATVVSFDPATMTAKCRVNNKRLVQLKDDGNQVLKDYPDIFARVHFIGWGDIGATFPINVGMEGILLFNDRELETWYMTSEAGNLAYDRCHDLSDALFICGVHSQPKIPLVQFIEECLHIYYKNSDFQIKDTSITANTTDFNLNSTTNTIKSTNTNITSTITQTGDVTINGTTKSTTLQDLTAATNTFTTSDGKLVTVVNGIVRTIVG